jgi:hypothetical protein
MRVEEEVVMTLNVLRDVSEMNPKSTADARGETRASEITGETVKIPSEADIDLCRGG